MASKTSDQANKVIEVTATKAASAVLKPRPPIVVVMGHVDHGKTTLLDYIRKTNVAAREAGGITQATGAYEIVHATAERHADGSGAEATSGTGRRITFIDTPGHEAFTAMRSRGAQAADLAVLVVAADEGVKPQTKEAIKILTDSKTPFIVAFNKIDKVQGGTALEKAKTDLMTAGVALEGYGGQVSWHGISAKTGEGVSELLDLILLSADMEGLTYDPAAPATGFVLEARRDPRRGIEASVIVKNGVLTRGDQVATPTAGGKVKILEDFTGKAAAQLTPSAPGIVIGLEKLPKVGEEFTVGEWKGRGATQSLTAAGQIAKSKPNTLNLILKASDAGSLEALTVVLKSVDKQGGKEVNVVEESVGDVTDGDVRHAQATGSAIIGFKDKVEKGARNLADAQGVMVITSEIVYDLAKAVEDFLAGKLGPAAAGELEVLAVFSQDKLDKQLVGGRVTKGIFREKASFEIMRAAGGGTAGGSTAVGGEASATGSAGDSSAGDTSGGVKISQGMGRVLNLREKKSEIAQAEKGKEIGVLASAPIALRVGDTLVIRK